MDEMKKHPFLVVDYQATVKFSSSEQRQLDQWLKIAGQVLEKLFSHSLIEAPVTTIQVSLLICGDSRIKKLNREHRNKDKVTDVLSFPAHEDLRQARLVSPQLFLGDLAICHQQTKRQAKKFDITYLDEFIHLFFHGVLHLLGYDHEVSEKEEKLMEKWEKEALDLFSEIKKKAKKKAP